MSSAHGAIQFPHNDEAGASDRPPKGANMQHPSAGMCAPGRRGWEKNFTDAVDACSHSRISSGKFKLEWEWVMSYRGEDLDLRIPSGSAQGARHASTAGFGGLPTALASPREPTLWVDEPSRVMPIFLPLR